VILQIEISQSVLETTRRIRDMVACGALSPVLGSQSVLCSSKRSGFSGMISSFQKMNVKCTGRVAALRVEGAWVNWWRRRRVGRMWWASAQPQCGGGGGGDV